jgi:glycosyltransferase involved in cell wall biosynthesis
VKVLHLAPLWFPVSPDAAGGRETQLAILLKHLQPLGVTNTVLATGDSRVEAELIPVAPQNLMDAMKAGVAQEYHYFEQHLLCLAHDLAGQFDVIHSHLSPAVFAGFGPNFLHTQHTPVWQDLQWFVGRHPNCWINTVSEYQARHLRTAGARRVSVIHNGAEPESFPFQPEPGGGLVFLGRLESAKGPDLAIQVARQLGCPLTLAGPIVDPPFFDQQIAPNLDAQIRYVGVVNHAQKTGLLGAARVALLPFRGAEGFGMVSIEAMACGTPVVALANGALPEVVEPGVTGYLTRTETELPALVQQAAKLDRAAVRARMAARFDMRIVAQKYRQLYDTICAASATTRQNCSPIKRQS